MADKNDKTDFESVIAPPNGERVTQALLYKSLYDLDRALTDRFTTLMDAIVEGNGVASQLRKDFEGHRSDGHPQNMRAEVIREEIKLDTKKAAIVLSVLTVFSAIFAAVAKVVADVISQG